MPRWKKKFTKRNFPEKKLPSDGETENEHAKYFINGKLHLVKSLRLTFLCRLVSMSKISKRFRCMKRTFNFFKVRPSKKRFAARKATNWKVNFCRRVLSFAWDPFFYTHRKKATRFLQTSSINIDPPTTRFWISIAIVSHEDVTSPLPSTKL